MQILSCEFPKVVIQSCDFKYSRFESCAIPFHELEHSLPREPNLRHEFTHALSVVSDGLGRNRDGRLYRLASIRARQEHLRAAIVGKSDWYQSHYSGLRKIEALGQLLASKANNAIWGHGESWLILVRNLLSLAFLVFPASLWFTRGGLVHPSRPIEISDLLWLSVTTIVPVCGVSPIQVNGGLNRAILTLEAFAGVVVTGLFIVLLVRRMLKR